MTNSLPPEAPLTPFQKARSVAAARAIAAGRIEVRHRCGYCSSASVVVDTETGAELDERGKPKNLACVACGRRTPVSVAKKLRQQAIKAIIREGIDIHQPKGASK